MSSSQKSQKITKTFLPSIFILFVCLLFLIYSEKALSRCGDVDGDGNIFSNDVLMVARASINILTLTADQKLRTDVVVCGTPDGQILSNDLLIIARASLGMVTPLCNENVSVCPGVSGFCLGMSSVTGTPSSTVDIITAVSKPPSPGISSAMLKFTWDSAKLSFNSATMGTGMVKQAENSATPGVYTIALTSGSAITSETILFTLKFNVAEGATGSIPLNIDTSQLYTNFTKADTSLVSQSLITFRNGSINIGAVSSNNIPVITSTVVTSATVGTVYYYDVNATDADSDMLTYSLTTAPTGMTINSLTGLVSWSPSTGGSNNVSVSVSDGKGGIASQSFTVNANTRPTISSTAISTASVGLTYSYAVNVTDADGDTLTYSLTTSPAGVTMTINSTTGLIQWTPPSACSSVYVYVSVSDGKGDTATQYFTVNVNCLPTITSTAITTATVGIAYTYDVNASDANSDTLTYSLTTAPAEMPISATSGLILWTPSIGGSNNVSVSVSDGKGGIASQSFTINVNTPPSITSTAIATAAVGLAYSYDVNATDVDSDTLTYSFASAPTGMTINSTTGLISWGPSTGGSFNTIVSVSDSKGGVASQSFTIVVNTKPTVSWGSLGYDVVVGQTATATVVATDTDGDALTYSLTNAPEGMMIDSTTGLISWTPSTSGSFHDIIVSVSDGRGGIATQSFWADVPNIITSSCSDVSSFCVAVSDATGTQGGTVDVTVSVANLSTITAGLAVVNAKFMWDSTKLTFNSVTMYGMTKQTERSSVAGIYEITASSFSPAITTNATLFTLRFNIVSGITGQIPIIISTKKNETNFTDNNTTLVSQGLVTFRNGTITVQ